LAMPVSFNAPPIAFTNSNPGEFLESAEFLLR
jgi:hypothetical protein